MRLDGDKGASSTERHQRYEISDITTGDEGVQDVYLCVLGVDNHVSIILPAALYQLPRNSRLAAFSILPTANHR